VTGNITDIEPLELSAAEVAVLSKIAGSALRDTPDAVMKGFKGDVTWPSTGDSTGFPCPRSGATAVMRSYWWSRGNALVSFVHGKYPYVGDNGTEMFYTNNEVWTWQYSN